MSVLQIEQWAAWAPGLDTQTAWTDWLRAPAALQGATAPPLAEVPAMARRRIDPLGRAALQVAYWAQQDLDPEAVARTPMVFASRWGEFDRSMAMLQQLARGEALSPTAFSHSVHNAIAALYSIQRGIRANVSAVAGSDYSAEAGWTEAAALLATGAAESVLLVVCDAALPPAYASCGLESPLTGLRAYALRLRLATRAGVSLQRSPTLQEPTDDLPADLRVLSVCLGQQARLAQGGWQWSRVDG